MSGAVEPETGRPRPLSGTLWTLFSWLRRDDAGSSDSLSSAGSDRSAASFAFLSPAHFRHSAPVPRPPPPPPTDSYKKRVHDRNLRRQHDRDLTLHRKYGLFRGDTTIGYDVTSLPSARRSARSNSDKQDRERRAISESLQRRTPYVPGKRRAPLPPVQAAAGTSATLPYRHSRKRRAPQPPIKIEEKAKENFEEVQGRTGMNPTPGNSKVTLPSDVTIGCKSEKYVKKEQHETTETKSKPEKSFLKQIFENNKKRRSAIETTMRILPSISELDKQAAEIIETSRFKEREQNLKISKIDEHGEKSDMTKGPRWICVTCLRCFDESINTCSFCLSSQKPINNFVQEKNRNVTNTTQTSKNLEDDERQQLKKMLKEMKDSLPKKQKPVEDIFARDVPVMTASLADKGPVTISETPTLCVRSKHQELNLSAAGEPSPSKKVLEESKNIPTSDNTNEIVRKILLQGTVKSTEKLMKNITNNTPKNMMRDRSAGCKIDDKTNRTECLHLSDTKQISTPLKISSLLNPVYIPKQLPVQPNTFSTNTSKNEDDNVVSKHTKNVILNETSQNKTHIVPSTSNMLNIIGKTTVSTESQTNSANQKSITTKVDEISQHSRRRELINQLEKSIADGDERAAADAAAKLAQLRLSCSVLSFTSQILSNKDNAIQQTKETVVKNENQILKGPSALNICVTNSTVIPASSKTPEINSVRKLEPNNKQVDKPETSSSKSPLKTDASASHSQVVHGNGAHMVFISVWIEDKNATRGPLKLQINRNASVGLLRGAAEAGLGIARELQRWIVGRTLCLDDATPLVTLAGEDLDAPFYLCVVEFDSKQKASIKDGSTNSTRKISSDIINTKNNDRTGDVYTELMQLERQALVPNGELFECEICMEPCPVGHGAVLRECVHSFCRNCLADMIRHCEEPAVSCPAMGCPGTLHEREIRALITPEEYERWLAKGLAFAESGTRNAFHCRTRDCTGWALCDAGVRKFPCPVCKHINCVPCQAIHEGDTCEKYRSKLQQTANQVSNQTDEVTKALLDSLISRGEALECPECSAIITKKWGCDWVKCSACKTEICWVTRGRRWGPGGRGDTSAGCRCGVEGKRCHPSCGYCH